jgi:hypothetical protein
MAEVAVGTVRVVAWALVIPVADDAGGEHQQRDQREGNSENANSFPQDQSVAGSPTDTTP